MKNIINKDFLEVTQYWSAEDKELGFYGGTADTAEGAIELLEESLFEHLWYLVSFEKFITPRLLEELTILKTRLDIDSFNVEDYVPQLLEKIRKLENKLFYENKKINTEEILKIKKFAGDNFSIGNSSAISASTSDAATYYHKFGEPYIAD